jgi:hypothetical protein
MHYNKHAPTYNSNERTTEEHTYHTEAGDTGTEEATEVEDVEGSCDRNSGGQAPKGEEERTKRGDINDSDRGGRGEGSWGRTMASSRGGRLRHPDSVSNMLTVFIGVQETIE